MTAVYPFIARPPVGYRYERIDCGGCGATTFELTIVDGVLRSLSTPCKCTADTKPPDPK